MPEIDTSQQFSLRGGNSTAEFSANYHSGRNQRANLMSYYMKDHYKDQLRANVNKIKTFRDTGEFFDTSNQDLASYQSVTSQ